MKFYQQHISKILAFLYFLGVGISYYLSTKHVDAKIAKLLNKNSDDGICGAYDVFSCHEAANSEFSRILGFSIANIGESYYLIALLMLLILMWIAQKNQVSESEIFGSVLVPIKTHSSLFYAALFFIQISAVMSLLYSLFLAGVSVFSLGKLCPFCIGLYVVNALIFWVLWPRLSVFGNEIWTWQSIKPYLSFWYVLILGIFMGLLLMVQLHTLGYEKELRVQHKDALYKEPVPKLITGLSIDQSPIKGNGEVTIYEFSDFQCPFCKRLSENLKEAQSQNPKIQYVFKHYPLSSTCNEKMTIDLHKDACIAAKAGICAQNQGKFWEMHDVMFENQKDLEEEELMEYAGDLSLDISKFKTCLSSPETAQRLKDDIDLAIKIGVHGTPIFIINQWGFVGAKPADEILKFVEKYKDKKN